MAPQLPARGPDGLVPEAAGQAFVAATEAEAADVQGLRAWGRYVAEDEEPEPELEGDGL